MSAHDKSTLRMYRDYLTVAVNAKGVVDVDTVKGCTSGIAAHGPKGCYQACYAAEIARFRGIDFSRSVTRIVRDKAQAIAIERAVKKSALGFFRIGTMGDPSHAWGATVDTVEWLSPNAVPIIVTKHWRTARDSHIDRLVKCGAVLNTSVSALDSQSHLDRRLFEIARYADAGGVSVARIVSCDFVETTCEGARRAQTQRELFALPLVLDNPLRISSTHPLAVSGAVRLRKVKDLDAIRTISISEDSTTYLGHCSACPDMCGASMGETYRPTAPQADMFKEYMTA